LSTLFRNYYRERFPSLWVRFDGLVEDGLIISTREVLHEVNDGAVESLREWASGRKDFFSVPRAEEGAFIAQIFKVSHFQQNIEQQKLLKGGRNADPFVIAKAATVGCAVVTMELFKENGVKIPNICRHFGVQCFTLEGFMEHEGWKF
jgi:hypothetical protein